MKNLLDYEYEIDHKFWKRFNCYGAWRGLFDAFSCEYNDSTITQKVDLLFELQAALECSLHDLVWAYVKHCILIDRTYQLDGLPFALHEIAEVSDEVKSYLESTDHPALRIEDVDGWLRWLRVEAN